MNPYIGDRPLDPPEDDECETCDGSGIFVCGPFNQICPECCDDSDPGEPNPYPED